MTSFDDFIDVFLAAEEDKARNVADIAGSEGPV